MVTVCVEFTELLAFETLNFLKQWAKCLPTVGLTTKRNMLTEK